MRKVFLAMLLLAAANCFADQAYTRMAPYLVDRVSAANEGSRLVNAEKSSVAPGRAGVSARSAEKGGSFSYRLKVDKGDSPQLLHVRYSGDEHPKRGEELIFRIFIDGEQLTKQGIDRNFPNSFVDEYYPVPAAMLEGKKEVAVTFRPYREKSSVAGIYAVSILRDKTNSGCFDRLDRYEGIEVLAGKYSMPVPGRIRYTEPDGPKGWYAWGWLKLGDGVYDMTENYGLEFEVELTGTDSAVLVFTATMNTQPKEDRDAGNISRTVRIPLADEGKQSVILKFEDFINPTANVSDVAYRLKTLDIAAEGAKGKLGIDAVRLLKGYKVALDIPRRSRSADPGNSVEYTMTVTNTAKERMGYELSCVKRNWEAMETRITPSTLFLKPGGSAEVKIKVSVPARIPAGGHEKQLIRVTPNGDPAAAVTAEFITFARKPSPYTLHDAEGWEEVKAKAAKHQWAKERFDKYVESARKWNVPERAIYNISTDISKRRYLFSMQEEHNLMNAAIAWRLTGDKAFAEKAALFLRRVSDPEDGYPVTGQVGHQSEVQEGHMFQHLAHAYDMIRDAGVLSQEDIKNIETTFRLFCGAVRRHNSGSGGANWALSLQAGALFCALALEDLSEAEYFTFGPGMITDKLSSYTMSDGWWYECSISYNLWCAEEFTQVALAMERFGYSLLNRKYPVYFAYAPDYQLDDATELDQRLNVHYGHSFRKFGGIESTTVSIKKMFDAMTPYIDYRGWIFGINDSYETNVGGGRFELAYYAFRDPAYAAFIKRAPKRDNLLYGVPELPDDTPEIGKGSAYSDNVGLLMLRSNQKEPRERIQAVLKYGTHGGYHGHYDRTGLLSMMRYGRSFFNPEMIWYSYQPFMYNFYVQSSVAKNMVTVDLKQQEVDDSARTLFHTGERLQAGCVETTSRWSNPGFGGLRWGHIGFSTFSSKTVAEGRFVPLPDPEPRYGSMSGFTEPILQRRLMAVTDDYIVLADYIRGDTLHKYDLLFQVKGLLGIEGAGKRFSGHSAQLDPDPLKSAQFITDVNFYEIEGTAKMSFLTKFGPDGDNRGTRMYGEDGDLYIDVHHAWPNGKRTLFTGLAPENHNVARKLAWQVKGDGRLLAEGEFGAWILGEDKIDADLTGIGKLELSTAIEKRAKINTLFWADAVIVTGDGKTIPLHTLKSDRKNVLEHKFGIEKDYEGGKINIAGNDCKTGLPADPVKTGEGSPAIYTFDLTGLNAVRFKATVGGDYPVGPQAERRITSGVRIAAKESVFLSVMEPFETKSVIADVSASSAGELTVRLKDGRTQAFRIEGLEGGSGKASIRMKEFDKEGKLLHEEAAMP